MTALVSSPISTLSGTANVPGDKSISHRALMIGALVLGLLGEIPSEIDPETVTVAVDEVINSGQLKLDGAAEILFSISDDIFFEYGVPLDEHTNGLEAKAFDA